MAFLLQQRGPGRPRGGEPGASVPPRQRLRAGTDGSEISVQRSAAPSPSKDTLRKRKKRFRQAIKDERVNYAAGPLDFGNKQDKN
jgi:hypothetical protein